MSEIGPELRGCVVGAERIGGSGGHVVALELENKDVVFFTIDAVAQAYADRETMSLKARALEAPEPGSRVRVDVGLRFCVSREREAARALDLFERAQKREQQRALGKNKGRGR